MTTLTDQARLLTPPRWSAIPRGLAPLIVGISISLVLHLFVRPHLNPYHADILVSIGINVVLAVSLTVVNGFTGQFSIGHAGFMALGAYTGAAITYYGSIRLWESPAFAGGILSWATDLSRFTGGTFGAGDLLFVAACIAGGLVAAIAGVVVGLPSLRLRGDYLAIVTLGFGEIVRIVLQQSPEQIMDPQRVRDTPVHKLAIHLNGALGMYAIPLYASLFWVGVVVTAVLVASYRLKRSSHGRAMLAVRENEIAAAAVGVPVVRCKVFAFAFAAFFAGVAGALSAHQLGTVSAAEMGFQKSFDILIMVVLGGLGSISGSVIAAIGLTILPELLRSPPHVWPVMLTAIVIVLAVRRGRGLRVAMVLTAITTLLELLRWLAIRNGINLAEYRMVFYALALILIMILRPQGLLGVHELWDLPVFLRRIRRVGREKA